MATPHAIVVKGLKKSFGELIVLDGIDFSVKSGSILALLGPNGAGKTTTVRILSTLLKPDKGTVLVNGHDVVKEPDAVRSSIGLTGQYAAVDEYLSAQENLVMMGRLYHLEIGLVNERSRTLLKRFDLLDALDRPVKTFSGGMRRRLDLAMSLIASPPIIFLDEPTTGLDPRSRLMLWAMIKALAESGTTILLTTQHMDEADHLADAILVIDNGKVIAQGTSDELKKRIGSDRLEITLTDGDDMKKAQKTIDAKEFDKQRRTLSIATHGGVTELKRILHKLELARIDVESVSLHRPTLDDVFLNLTGHKATKETEEGKP